LTPQQIADSILALAAGLDSAMTAHRGVSSDATARVLVEARAAADAIEAAVKSLDATVRRFSEVDVPETFEALKVNTVSVRDELDPGKSYRITVGMRLMASILADRKPDAYAWLRASELGGLIYETVNSQSLSAAIRERLERGEPVPDELINTHIRATTSITTTRSKTR
jgi:hypothetical protein